MFKRKLSHYEIYLFEGFGHLVHWGNFSSYFHIREWAKRHNLKYNEDYLIRRRYFYETE